MSMVRDFQEIVKNNQNELDARARDRLHKLYCFAPFVVFYSQVTIRTIVTWLNDTSCCLNLIIEKGE